MLFELIEFIFVKSRKIYAKCLEFKFICYCALHSLGSVKNSSVKASAANISILDIFSKLVNIASVLKAILYVNFFKFVLYDLSLLDPRNKVAVFIKKISIQIGIKNNTLKCSFIYRCNIPEVCKLFEISFFLGISVKRICKNTIAFRSE